MNQQPQIDPTRMSVVECPVEGCDSKLWKERLQIRRASPITSPTGQEMFAQIPVLICDKCGTPYPVKGLDGPNAAS